MSVVSVDKFAQTILEQKISLKLMNGISQNRGFFSAVMAELLGDLRTLETTDHALK